jgi:hypothetical protein
MIGGVRIGWRQSCPSTASSSTGIYVFSCKWVRISVYAIGPGAKAQMERAGVELVLPVHCVAADASD